ncbi:MAG: NAD(P)H-hydrate epimerase, partial [Mesorhizobium sp.]
DGIGLMRNAGSAVAAVVLAHFPAARRVHVLCGPGNNGGDGYVVARILRDSAVDVLLWASGSPKAGSDAALAASECPVRPRPLSEFAADKGSILVDALYGAGLSKPLSGDAARAVEVATELNLPVVAVDLPSGVSGESGQIFGRAFRAQFTVTFARKKPGHLLLPGRGMCGELVLADIGISDDIVAQLAPRTFENIPPLKYRRGHVGVFSGGPSATGAARLSALAAARSGAGAVTMLSPANAVQVNAAHLTSIMLKKADSIADVQEFIDGRRPSAFVLGPGFGVGEKTRDFALGVLAAGDRKDGRVDGLVLDA